MTDDDVHTLLSALTQKNHARAYPGLINVWITLLQECRTVCGDGKAAALAMALFLGVGDSRSKQRRQTPFAVLANYRMTSVTSDEEKTNKSNPVYSQVFANKHGYLDNLSILDLLFNLGPESVDYLMKLDV